METQKTDRRVKYSVMVIKESFVKILKQKSISKITIKEICEGADVNRATFYAHFSDQYDLLNQIENEQIDSIDQYLSSHNFRGKFNEPNEMLINILDYIKGNAELFDLLLNSNGDIEFREKLTTIIGEQHFSSLTKNKDDSEYVFLFFANGCIGVIQKWLKDGLKKSAEEMAELIAKVASNGKVYFVD